jgi:putative NIF3 family GTP cyclohydrolase 1 type 2
VALLPGSGGDSITAAKHAGADLLITGDVNHHQALLAHDVKLPVFSAGHFETERPGIIRLHRLIKQAAERRGLEIDLTVLDESPPFHRF